MLEGYEKEWHYNGRNRIASYTNVRPGKYVFRVRTVDEANPEQIYETTLAIRILPPWWLSWWAYCIYAVLGITLLIVVIRVSYLMIRMKNDVYIEQKLSELKIKFFTNISHKNRCRRFEFLLYIYFIPDIFIMSNAYIEFHSMPEKHLFLLSFY